MLDPVQFFRSTFFGKDDPFFALRRAALITVRDETRKEIHSPKTVQWTTLNFESGKVNYHGTPTRKILALLAAVATHIDAAAPGNPLPKNAERLQSSAELC